MPGAARGEYLACQCISFPPPNTNEIQGEMSEGQKGGKILTIIKSPVQTINT